MERIKTHLKKVKPHHIVSALAVVGIAFAAVSFNNPPLFNNIDNFVLFAQEEIKLEQGVQVSSGDLGSNGKIDVEKDNIINGNLFSDKIELDKNTTINGNVSFNKLQIHKESKILGTQTKSVQLPIANLPEISDFQIGTQDFKFTGQNNSIPSGSYRNILLEKDSKLTLTGGVYNLNKLELKENSTLIFNSPTALNIHFKLRGQKRVSILTGNNNLKPTDLVINYLGLQAKNEKVEKEDDDEEISALHDEKEKKEHKEGKIGRPVIFGKESFLNFKLLAPKASIKLGEASTVRGQVLARKVKMERGGILSREEIFSKDTDLNKIIITGGETFPLNEIVIVLQDSATFSDAQSIVNLVGGRITGFIPEPQIYKIEVPVSTASALNDLINMLEGQHNSLILFVVKNLSGGLR